MKRIWNYIKIVFLSIAEAREFKVRESLKKNNYHHM